MCEMLLDKGADMRATNEFGQDVMHIASQGNEPISLYFFKQKGMSLTTKD